jgi:hypothetical protein
MLNDIPLCRANVNCDSPNAESTLNDIPLCRASVDRDSPNSESTQNDLPLWRANVGWIPLLMSQRE